MKVTTGRISVQTGPEMQVMDITDLTSGHIKKSGVRDGIVNLFVPGSTGALTTVEYEPGLEKDLHEFCERIIPRGGNYHHELAWHDGNGHSHVRASLFGPSLAVPVVKGMMTLGTWQQIIFIDFDRPSRDREIVVQIMGD
jgi:secondary thiamine-phosphate synthase enzyme